jgi:hypothetical protein
VIRQFVVAGTLAGLAVLAIRPARAASVVIAPGEDYTLTGDVMLGAAESFVAGGDASQARCKIHGGGFGVTTVDQPTGPTPWTGAITIRNCDVDGLGSAGKVAVLARGSGAVTIQADSVVPQPNDSEPNSVPTFHAEGVSTGSKVISGNTFRVGRIHLQSTSGWVIGGDTPADGNVLVGVRTGIKLEGASDIIVRGNYSHTMIGDPKLSWNQVKNLSIADGAGILVEHNVFRGLNWVVELNGGAEVRYNLLFDAVERGWALFSSNVGAKIHHNVLIAIKQSQLTPAGAFVLENEGAGLLPDAEVYNNTLDAGGVCNPGVQEGAVVFHGGAVLGSLRSNAITGVRFGSNRGTALVRDSPGDPADPLPVRLLYSDYNLFADPDSPMKTIYGVGVDGKTLGADPGFGLHDLPKGVALDGTVKPGFNSRAPRSFPFTDEDLIARTSTTCQVLAFYRQAYTPGDGSPLVDAGDPAEGAGNDIGAIGAGTPNALDKFASGGFCDPQDTGHPTITADTYTCATVPIDVGSSGDPMVTTPLPSGITCVCRIDGGGAGDPFAWLLPAGGIALALARRRRVGR